MPRIAISLDLEVLRQVDQLVKAGFYQSRSRLIQDAIAEKLRRVRLAGECEKLQPTAEQVGTEEVFCSEVEWPEY